MTDPAFVDPALYNELQEKIRKLAREIDDEKEAQLKREKSFGRHLDSSVIDGIYLYPEMLNECDESYDTLAEKVAAYNEACFKYDGNYSHTLSNKSFKRLARRLK